MTTICRRAILVCLLAAPALAAGLSGPIAANAATDQPNTSTAATSPISGDYLGTTYGSVAPYYLGQVNDTDTDANTLAGWQFTVNWGDSTSTTCDGGSTGRFCGTTGFPTFGTTTYPSGNPDFEVVCQTTGTFCDLYGEHHYQAAGRYAITITSSESSGADADGDSGATAPTINETIYYDVYVTGGSSACVGVVSSNCVSTDFTGQSATEGASKTYNVAYVTDGGAPPLASQSATISWGDATTSSGSVGPCMNGCYVKGTHTYADEGSYKARADVTDSSQTPPITGSNDCPATTNGRSTCTPTTIKVYDAALSNSGGNQLTSTSPSATSPGNCTVLASCSGIVATFTDTNASCNSEGEMISPVDGSPHYQIQVSYGDASPPQSPTAVTQRGSTCVFDIAGSHVYTAPGTYTVTVTVVDEGCTVQPPPTVTPGCRIVITSTVTVGVPAGTSGMMLRNISAYSNRTNPNYYVYFLCMGTMGCGGTGYHAQLDYRDFNTAFFINKDGVTGGAVYGPGIMAARPDTCSNQFPNPPYCTLAIDSTVETSPGHVSIYGHYVNNGRTYYVVMTIAAGSYYTGSFQITASSPAGVYTGPAVPVTATVM